MFKRQWSYISSVFLPLPGYDSLGRKVVIIRTALHNPVITPMDEVFKTCHFIGDILVEEDEQCNITGYVQILDLAGVTAAHGLQMSPPLVKKAMTIWQIFYWQVCQRHNICKNKTVCVSVFLPLPGYDPLGRKLVIIRTALHDPKTTPKDEVFKATHFINDVLVDEDEKCNVKGLVQIIYLDGVTAGHALQMSPQLVKKAMIIWQIIGDIFFIGLEVAVLLVLIFFPLPGLDYEGRKVLFGRWGCYDPYKVSMDDLIKLCALIFDAMLDEEEESSIIGVVIAGDCKNLSVAHAMGFTPSVAKRCAVLWQVCLHRQCGLLVNAIPLGVTM
ncbi:hypothetical protein SK128_017446 [Halocaridina rubra]|uniref:CRAL-TRIO domain-containing protein n=1 Tax=Halocaridina rubra TaxID=373956 RepID=A0AAN9AGR0_HALRR